MILALLILVPAVGGLLAMLAAYGGVRLSRWVSLAATLAQLAIVAGMWTAGPATLHAAQGGTMRFSVPWIPQIGASISLAMDGLSLVLVSLTAVLGVLSVAASWTSIQRRAGFFHFNLLWSLAAVTGAFLAEDMLLFYLFWEMILVPLYFLIRIWGHENRIYAATKFFLFTQGGGLLLLLGILGVYFIHGRSSGVYTFDFRQLIGTAMPPALGFWLMLAFLAAFAVKLPVIGLHTWLPDAHTQAPVAGSVVLAGLVLKVGAYGILRFVAALFPAAAGQFAPVAMWLGAAGVLYGAAMACGQTNLKRLIAYTSVSHMGFVLMGAFAGSSMALQGTVILMLAHGLSTGGLFIMAGMLHERLGTYELDEMGGLWAQLPRIGGASMVLAMATLGLPGLGNFVGEWLVLQGSWQSHPAVTAVAAGGFVLSVIYSLRMMQRVFFGKAGRQRNPRDATPREMAMAAGLIALLLWLGLYPQTFIRAAGPAASAAQAEIPRAAEPGQTTPRSALLADQDQAGGDQ